MKKHKYSFECDDSELGQFFDDACEEIEELRLWESEKPEYKDHKNTGGHLLYCGNSYIHAVELLYGTGTERLIPMDT